MKILAIVGSYRKHRTIDALVDRALAGATAGRAGDVVEKVYLADQRIEYCRNCASCKKTDPAQPIADRVEAAGEPPSAAVSMGKYSLQIFSKTPSAPN